MKISVCPLEKACGGGGGGDYVFRTCRNNTRCLRHAHESLTEWKGGGGGRTICRRRRLQPRQHREEGEQQGARDLERRRRGGSGGKRGRARFDQDRVDGDFS